MPKKEIPILKMMKKSIVIHPFLLAAYPVLFLYSHNIGQVSFRETFIPIAIILGLTLLAWAILGFIIKNWRKSGIIVSLFLALFFSYGHFRIPLERKELIILISSAWILLFTLGVFLIFRSRRDFTKATLVLNVAVGILVAMPMANIFIHLFSGTGRINSGSNSISMRTDLQLTTQTQSYPDIYFIILDAYGREDILNQMYGFNNSEFLNFLRERGFYIAARAASNYCQTGLSVGSCFNLAYLDEQVKEIGQHNISREPLRMILKSSLVLNYLKSKGYNIVTFASDRPEIQLKSEADTYLKPGTLISMFQNALKNMTPLPDILALRRNHNGIDKYRQNILYILDNIGKVAGLLQSPKFVFAYIESPHPPFVFGSKGEPRNIEARLNDHDGNWLISPGRLTLEQYRTYYIDQIIFLNSRMKEVVIDIIENSKQPPIIMILGDHGPRSEVVWENPKKTNMKECMTILNAYYLPNSGDKLLYPQITPVNSFRVIFNYYFNQQLDMLPDRQYFSTAKYLYKFYEVTEEVQKLP